MSRSERYLRSVSDVIKKQNVKEIKLLHLTTPITDKCGKDSYFYCISVGECLCLVITQQCFKELKSNECMEIIIHLNFLNIKNTGHEMRFQMKKYFANRQKAF